MERLACLWEPASRVELLRVALPLNWCVFCSSGSLPGQRSSASPTTGALPRHLGRAPGRCRRSPCSALPWQLSLSPVKLAELHSDLKIQERDELSWKKLKVEGLDEDGQKEAQLVHSLNGTPHPTPPTRLGLPECPWPARAGGGMGRRRPSGCTASTAPLRVRPTPRPGLPLCLWPARAAGGGSLESTAWASRWSGSSEIPAPGAPGPHPLWQSGGRLGALPGKLAPRAWWGQLAAPFAEPLPGCQGWSVRSGHRRDSGASPVSQPTRPPGWGGDWFSHMLSDPWEGNFQNI